MRFLRSIGLLGLRFLRSVGFLGLRFLRSVHDGSHIAVPTQRHIAYFGLARPHTFYNRLLRCENVIIVQRDAFDVCRKRYKRNLTDHVLVTDKYTLRVLLTTCIPTHGNVGQDALVVLFERNVRVLVPLHESEVCNDCVPYTFTVQNLTYHHTFVTLVCTIVQKYGILVVDAPVNTVSRNLNRVQINRAGRKNLFLF